MALGIKDIQIHTENPLDVKREIEQNNKESQKEIIKTILGAGLKIARIIISK